MPGQDKHGVTSWELPQGARIVLRPLPGAKVAAVYAAVKGGLSIETESVNGISSLVAATVDRGTESRSDDRIAEEVTAYQADLEGVAGRNFQGLRMETVGRHFDGALDLFLDILFRPTFRRHELQQERNVLLRELETQKDYFEAAAGNLFIETLYPGHPYGLNLLGHPVSLPTLGTRSVRDHYRKIMRPNRLVLAIAGNIDPGPLRDRLERSIPADDGGDAPPEGPPPLVPFEGAREVRRPIHGEKAYVQYGFRGTRLDAPDRFALEVLSALLASSGGGRLYVRLREELGLVYTVDSSVNHGLAEGCFAIGFNTAPGQADQALEEVRRSLAEVREKAVPAEELERVKNFMIGSYEIDLQRAGPQAAQLCTGALYGTERTLADYPAGVREVTAADVREAARRYFTADRSVLVILSPAVN